MTEFRRLTILPMVLLLGIAACGSDDATPATTGAGGSGGAAGSGGSGGVVTELTCPTPGALPFETATSDFSSSGSADVVSAPRNKDEAADILGNPGGAFVYTSMPQDDPPLSGDLVFAGRKARGASGLSGTGFSEEAVSLWVPSAGQWTSLAAGATGVDGRYEFALPGTSDPVRAVYSILEGDGTCAIHYAFQLAPGSKVVFADIDETLTTSDSELLTQIGDGSHDPAERPDASTAMSRWAEKGYQLVYLTARPDAFRRETRTWLDEHGFPVGPVVTANSLVSGDTAREYKQIWVSRAKDALGWDVVAAYGNATSDIGAYEGAGIPKDVTFIIGDEAGTSGTTGISDYASHLADYIEQQPDA